MLLNKVHRVLKHNQETAIEKPQGIFITVKLLEQSQLNYPKTTNRRVDRAIIRAMEMVLVEALPQSLICCSCN